MMCEVQVGELCYVLEDSYEDFPTDLFAIIRSLGSL